MKAFLTKLALCYVFVLFTFQAIAQAPQKFSYQAVVRDASGNLVINRPVGIRFTILRGTATGIGVFAETHRPTTNNDGLASVEIGGGSALFNAMGNIDWSLGPYFLKTEIDPNGATAYSISGTNQMLSVPYALYAEKSANPGNPGFNTLILTTPTSRRQGGCRFGGTKVMFGLDSNRNNVLDANEVDNRLTTFVCNGKDGIGITSTVDNGNGTFTFTYTDGTSFTTGNLTGPQGPIGLTGPQGATGATGPQGVQGPIGLTGPQGATGATGPIGPIGSQGPIGLTGSQGATGATGLQGPIGLTGPQGATGATGLQGPIGLTGPQGATGATGPQGPIGLTGPQGATGATGPQGPIGLTGASGPAGTNGQNGVSVTNSFVQNDSLYVVLSSGQTLNTGYVRGSVGATGQMGPIGPQGSAGFLNSGSNAGNTVYWDGNQWIVNNSNIYNNGANIGVGTVTPDNSAKFDVNSTTQGFLAPRMTNTQRNSITSPADGLIIFNISTGCPNYYFNGTWNEWCGTGVLPNGILGSLSCGTASNNGTLSSGVAASGVSSVISYTGGNGGTYNGQTVSSTGVSGLTATLSAGTFVNGVGTLTYTITGTPVSNGTASFTLNIGGQTCVLTRTVALPIGSITALNCGTATNNGTITAGVAAVGVSSTLSYNGGNGGTHNGQTVISTGVTGLTATLTAGTFVNGAGNLTYTITGTPASGGTASFALLIGSQTCILTRVISAPFTCGNTITDIDGNIYNTVQINGQCWMKENLKVQTLNDGTALTSPNDWRFINNDPANFNTYGRLYTGAYNSDPRGLCPAGWHVPSKTEMDNMVLSISGYNSTAAAALRSTTWSGDNSSGFTALPGGYILNSSTSSGFGTSTRIWTSTINPINSGEMFRISLTNSSLSIAANNYSGTDNSYYYVRCVKD